MSGLRTAHVTRFVDLFFGTVVLPLTIVIALLNLTEYLASWIVIAFLVVPSSFEIFFLVRSKTPKLSAITARSIASIIVVIVSAYMMESAPFEETMTQATAIIVVFFYQIVLTYSYITIGRNIAILPALKTVVKNGPYEIVRHPIYSCYFHIIVCIVLLEPSVVNMLCLLASYIGFYFRSIEEERVLFRSSEYRAYAELAGNRFFSFYFSAPICLLIAVSVMEVSLLS